MCIASFLLADFTFSFIMEDCVAALLSLKMRLNNIYCEKRYKNKYKYNLNIINLKSFPSGLYI